MTSNLGAFLLKKKKIGFGDSTKVGEMYKAVKDSLAPEFINRIDATVEFNKLTPDSC